MNAFDIDPFVTLRVAAWTLPPPMPMTPAELDAANVAYQIDAIADSMDEDEQEDL